jgi:non-lysosomal glucosylceramidase
MPKIEFGSKGQQYNRRYTRFFPDHPALGAELSAYTLATYPEWEEKISAWQDPILLNR